jgi:fructose/tagatose bisphosphate aldolase
MPLASAHELIADACRRGYAVGYFESWNLESLQGVVDAAEESRSPVVLGFNGEFLSRAGRQAPERLSWYAALGRAAAASTTVPCALLFNECRQDRWVIEALAAGFNMVMPADPGAPAPVMARRVAAIVDQAKARGAAVEGEVGVLPSGIERGEGRMTDPEEAAAFVAATGVDLLAVSVGNVHIRTEGEGELDLELLRRIRQRVPVPLALHGGTGIAAGTLGAAIRLGVVKVNYGTYLKEAYLRAVREAMGAPIENPHLLLGMGGPEDALVAGRRAVRESVLERIGLLGCRGMG